MPVCEHSWFSPSAAHRIILCPASVKASENVPKGEASPYAERGTECHAAMEKWEAFDIEPDPKSFKESWQYDACVAAHKQLNMLPFKNPVMQYETQVNLANLGHEDIFGTVDVIAKDVVDDEKILYIIDYKFGAGVKVVPAKNPQLMIYAIGACAQGKVDRIKLVIIQPRIYDAPQVWETTPDELLEWFKTTLDSAIKQAKDGEPYNPSPEACRWCPASTHNCHAILDDLVAMLPDPNAPIPEDTSKLAELMALKDSIISFFKHVEARAVNKLESGEDVPGYKLVKKYGRPTWADTKKAETFLKGCKFKQAERFKMTLITPAQAKSKLNAKGEMTQRRMNRINELTVTPERGYTIVPDDDKREAVNPKPATETLLEAKLEDLL